MTDDDAHKGESLFLRYLQTLKPDERQRLFATPASAFFIFRMLPSHAQTTIVKMIWDKKLYSGLTKEGHEVVRQQIGLLSRCGLVEEANSKPRLLKAFRDAYLKASVLGAYGCAGLRAVSEGDEKKAKKDITKNSTERWELVLRYLAIPSDQSLSTVAQKTKQLFKAAGFTTSCDGTPELTSAGFHFLLLSPVQQMWTYMIEYFKFERHGTNDVVEVLDLFIRIVLCVESKIDLEIGGRPFYLEDSWTERQLEIVMHLREIGLVYIRKRKDGHFYLSPLLCNLTIPSDDIDTSMQRREGCLVVETNYRVYAYTASSLQLAILSTFTEFLYRFPNMCVGVLTRDSVRKALQVGITAQQIVSYLRMNAHRQSLSRFGPILCVPITVAEQIQLWEEERKRLTYQDVVLYTGFESAREYDGVKQYAEENQILLHSDGSHNRMSVVVSEEGHEKVREWWRSTKHTFTQ
ncbi:unnamed protein product, partial [Mesorhabditis spiculigera]